MKLTALMRPIKCPAVDYLTTGLLYLLLPLFFAWRGIHPNYEWTDFFIPYWVSVSLYSVFAAALGLTL